MQTFGDWIRRPGGRDITIGLTPVWQLKTIDAERRTRYEELLNFYRLALAQGQTHKIWIAAADSKTRPDHAAANGQIQPINDSFSVGGELLFLPSDPNSSFHQSANCRCAVRYGTLSDIRSPGATPNLTPTAPAPPTPAAPGTPPPPALPVPAPVTPAAVPPVGPRYQVNLAEHEGGRYFGHSIGGHVGKSRAAIRAIMNIPVAMTMTHIYYKTTHGSFASLASANRLVNGALAANAATIDVYLRSGERDGLRIESFGTRITGMEGYRKSGIGIRPTPVNFRTTTGVAVYLVKDKTRKENFQIVTAFPVNR